MDIRQLKENIRNFSLDDGDLGSQGYTRVVLQLFGYTGHGKSSFINSCKYVLEEGENFIEYAEAKEKYGCTRIRNAYPLTDQITMIDNRGCNKMDGFERAEVYAQLVKRKNENAADEKERSVRIGLGGKGLITIRNFIPIGQKVNWETNYSAMMEAIEISEMDPNFTDFLVPIFVYSAMKRIHSTEMEELRTFLNNCVKMTGVVPIIVLTFKTKGDYLEMEKQFRLMGAETVIAIENYTKESKIKTPVIPTEILMVIDTALRSVRFCLERPRDPRRELIERKKFMYNYIHQIELHHEREKEREKSEREKEEKKQEEEKTWCTLM